MEKKFSFFLGKGHFFRKKKGFLEKRAFLRGRAFLGLFWEQRGLFLEKVFRAFLEKSDKERKIVQGTPNHYGHVWC